MASLTESEESPSPKIFIPEEWSEAAESIAYDSITSPPPVALICGAKNSGKTTFSRHLLNILLQRYKRVAYLDTDVGQTEFTAPGCLSLTVVDKITPDLTIPCLKTPERCFFYGDISSKRDPSAYLKFIFALYDCYRKVYCMSNHSESPGNTGVPLVVNTPGWVKGIGYDLLVDMLKHISPTHIVKICISAESKNLPAGAFWLDEGHDVTGTLIEINSARQDSLKRSVLVHKDARLLRDLRVMAYFRQCFPSDSSITTIKELAYALAAHPPYEIPMSIIKIKHLHCQVPSTEVFYSLNATIVGLAVSSEDSEHLPQCVGLGLVRGIDIFKRVLYVITPVLQNTLEKVDLLLQGLIQIPTTLLQVQGCISPYMAANVLPTS
ncbi:polynucleotide 5'-hydroxyl-kinase NOL9 [Rhododendron vialii]|uniref:polynucleotide 5'-hydroxyl-kinase NOL9 n=1 Tax=Rhododendron vialii TaxID=182163 RepID=UPI00265EA512|nr:polynucleotide 5'-hydroxyl-kinase NOL9 [Rhododendron vialii]